MKSILYLSCIFLLFSCKKDDDEESVVTIVSYVQLTVLPCKTEVRPFIAGAFLDPVPAFVVVDTQGKEFSLTDAYMEGLEEIYQEGNRYIIKAKKERKEIRGRDPYPDEIYYDSYSLEEVISTEKIENNVCP
ncbi:MAG: hypothetical protein Q4G18_08595 [Myroides sp.]|nr:hypothetical protein [Myroides sp.]